MAKAILHIFSHFFFFAALTLLTQVGGVAYVLSLLLSRMFQHEGRWKLVVSFLSTYLFLTLLLVPIVAPVFGREKIKHTQRIQPATYSTVLLNRNYVQPALNVLLTQAEANLAGSSVAICYLDANFPFFNGFPLLPHLSHDDGRKLDLSLVYETPEGTITDRQKSNSGYGIFAGPRAGESDQIRTCRSNGYWQYDFTRYITFGRKNNPLIFSDRGTKQLITAVLQTDGLGKLFIEPHLKVRLNLIDQRVRYHGCQAVRHDDHIHVQLR